MSLTNTGRRNNFDSLRLIFALLVIFSHAFPLGLGSYATEPLYVLTRGQTQFGNLSVWGFFVISGFFITQSWLRSPSAIKFLKHRIGRIYPGFTVVALLCALIIVPIASDAHTYTQVSLRHFFFHTLRLNIWEMPPVFMKNAEHSPNGSLWSIPYEFWCYLGVLILGLCHLIRLRYLLLAVFVSVIGWRLDMDITGWNPTGGILENIFGNAATWATVLPFFLAGMLFDLFGGHALLRAPIAILALLVLITSYFIPHGLIVSLPTCGAYALMQIAYLPALNPLNLGRYGDFSYGVYLYAYPVQQLLVMHAGGRMSPYENFAFAAPISLALGALSWFLIERHFVSRRLQLEKPPSEPHSNLGKLVS